MPSRQLSSFLVQGHPWRPQPPAVPCLPLQGRASHKKGEGAPHGSGSVSLLGGWFVNLLSFELEWSGWSGLFIGIRWHHPQEHSHLLAYYGKPCIRYIRCYFDSEIVGGHCPIRSWRIRASSIGRATRAGGRSVSHPSRFVGAFSAQRCNG